MLFQVGINGVAGMNENVKEKKVAIIGSGVLALHLSKIAYRLGIESHCFSNDTDSVVKGKCTKHHLIDIFDTKKIIAICKQLNVSGVIATTELTVGIASYVANSLGLVGIPLEVAKDVTNKYYVRSKVNDNSVVLQPRFKEIENRHDNSIYPLAFPVIVKPTSLGGKRGVLVARNQKEYEDAITYAYDSIPKGRCKIMIEEYIEGGKEFSVESLSYKGEHKVIQITEKVTSFPPHIVELGHLQPARISENMKHRIYNAIPQLLAQVGIDNTATHTEIKIVNDNIYLIEVNSRPGGDNIAASLVELSTGYSYLEGVIKIAIGEFEFPDYATFNKHTSGILFYTKQTSFLKKAFDECMNYDWCVEKQKASDELKEIENNNSWGTNYILFKSTNGVPVELEEFYA